MILMEMRKVTAIFWKVILDVFFFLCLDLKMQHFFYRVSLIFLCFLKKLVNLLVSMKINCKTSNQLILLSLMIWYQKKNFQNITFFQFILGLSIASRDKPISTESHHYISPSKKIHHLLSSIFFFVTKI